MLSAQNIEKWEGNFWLFSAYSEFIHEHHLISFQSYQFFRDKTWRWHFSGMVPNMFITKSMIPRPLIPILLWLDENLFLVTSTCMSYRRCGSRTDASRRKPGMGYSQAWLFTQNIKKLEGEFWWIFFNLQFSKKTPFFTYKIPVFSKPVTGIALKMRKSGPRSKIRSRNMFGWSILWLSFLTLDSRAGP